MTKQELRQIIRQEWLKYDENPYLYETAFEDGFLKGYELAQEHLNKKENDRATDSIKD